MSKVVKKNVIMDSDAMRRALVRIAHEIIEKNKAASFAFNKLQRHFPLLFSLFSAFLLFHSIFT